MFEIFHVIKAPFVKGKVVSVEESPSKSSPQLF